MAAENDRPRVGSLRSAEAGLHLHRRAEALRTAGGSGHDSGSAARCPVELNLAESAFAAWWRSTVRPALWWRMAKGFAARLVWLIQSRWMRGFGIGLGAVASACMLVAGALWWLLANGPISLDIATPWLTAAIAENFGGQFRVEIGGTVLERDDSENR